MTYGVVPALRHNPELTGIYEPLLTSREYHPELQVPATKVGGHSPLRLVSCAGPSDHRCQVYWSRYPKVAFDTPWQK
jgi:putative acyl-CoA dehydrogenase